MKVLLFAFGFALGLSALYAQDNPGQVIPAVVLKTNATTLLNPFKQSVMLTADIRLARQLSVDVGLGAFLSSSTFANQVGESYRGPRLRAGMKYYYEIRDQFMFYFGAEAKHNSVVNRQWSTVLRQGGQFQEIILIKREVNTWGGAGRFGGQFYMGAKKRVVVDLYVGAGWSAHHVAFGLPPDAERRLRDFQLFNFEYPAGRSNNLDILFGWHLGYAFW